MKFTPIPFSTSMVQAILEGRKTQTRRVCKHQYWSYSELVDVNVNGITQKVHRAVSCPYGKVGDVLWVREEHLIEISDDRKWISITFKDDFTIRYYYKDLSLNLLKKLYKRKTIGKWQRARFLPKELARIFLEVRNIRVERLHDISEEDAKLEGVRSRFNDPVNAFSCAKENFFDYQSNSFTQIATTTAVQSFSSLWRKINGAHSWDENPWVWVIEFKRIEKPSNFLS